MLIFALCAAMPAYADDLTAAQSNCDSWRNAATAWPVAKSGQKAVLYLWSPRMVLSVQHAAQVQAVAQSLGLRWQPMYDPRVPATEIQAALQADAVSVQTRQTLAASTPLCDADLLAQEQTLRHFPTAWVYRLDAQLGWQQMGLPIVSAMPAAFWRLALAERESTLLPPSKK
jgi:hypothetical protein